ncbi:MAG: PAS domain S-box protein [Anaerolineales bacterium]|nr:PAS domain S-box protein [Anaerolineales bacterium]MDW8279396.1 PAS domain S-box protein [Anaerolineales bacterium]
MNQPSSFGIANLLQPQDVSRFLQTVLWVFLGFLMLGSLTYRIAPGLMSELLTRNSLAMASVTALALLFLRRGWITSAILLVAAGCGSILFLAAWNGMGMRGPAFAALVLIVLGITQYWGQRAGVGTALLASVAGLVLLLAERQGWLPNVSRFLDDWFVWIIMTAVFILAALMTGLMLRYLEQSVGQLRQEQETTRRLNADLERRVAERTAELAESERLLKIISEHTQDVIWISDLRLRTRYITESGARWLGYASAEEVLRVPLKAVLTPESYALAKQTLQEELQKESQGSVDPYRWRALQLEYVRRNGTRLQVEVRASFLRDAQGHVIGVTGVNRDITERHWMEKALLESEERYRRITSVVSDYIYSVKVDAAGNFSPEWVAGAFDEITGYQFDEYLAAGGWDILRHPDALQQDERDRQTLQENRPLEGSILKIRRKDGQIRWVRNFAYPVWNREENRLVGVYGAVQDITYQKEYEERLHRLNQELERRVAERTLRLENALSELESFSYSISHDLRAPLRAVNGYAGMLLSEHRTDFGPEIIRKLEAIQQNGQRMGQLVDGLLEFLHSGHAPIERQLLEPNEIVQSVLARLQTQWEGREVNFLVGDLPACRANLRLLDKVYEGLISNAIKFTRDRQPAIIEIGALQKEGASVYFVRDNGVGFDMQYYDKLFGMFQRLHHVSDFEGVGASLAIIQRIINRHNGRIWAEAGVDQGATFYFTLG